MKKRVLAILLSLAMAWTLLPATVLAAEGSTITVYVTVAAPSGFRQDKDNHPVVQRAVTLTGSDHYDINDALYALHQAYYPDGAAAGYQTDQGAYGESISKLWGVISDKCGYCVNGTFASGLHQQLSNGDYLDAYACPNGEAYSVFSSRTVTVGTGSSVDLMLTNVSGYDTNWNPVFSPTAGATVTANGVSMKETGFDGKVSLSFDTAGTYVISANKPGIIPPACVVTVVAPVRVDVSAQQDGTFLIPHQTVSVPYGLAASYGYANDDSAAGSVTALDVLVRLHELDYGSKFTKDSCGSYLSASGGISKMFGTSTYGVGFAVNGENPNDGVLSGGYYTGYTAGQAAVSSGDQVEFFFYRDTTDWADSFAWFDAGAGRTSYISAEVGQEIPLTLKGYSYLWYGSTPQTTIDANTEPIADAQLTRLDDAGKATPLDGKVTDVNGKATVSFDTAGTYYLSAQYSAEQISSGREPFFLPYCRIVVGDAGSATANQATGLTVQGLSLSPEFSSTVTSYTLPDQSWGKNTVVVKLGADAASTITVSNNSGAALSITPGSESWTPVALTAGTNHLVFKVTPPVSSGQLPKTYEVSVVRGVALQSLSITGSSALSPSFSADGDSYAATALAGTQISLSALAGGDSTNSTVTVNDAAIAASYPISMGENQFHVKVASADGTVSKTYTLTVTGVAAASCDFHVSPSGAVLTLCDGSGMQVEPSSGTSYTNLRSGESYTYTVSLYDYVTERGTITAGNETAKTVTLSTAGTQPVEVAASWPGFRSGNDNLAVTSAPTPRTAAEASLLWHKQVGTIENGTVANAPSPQILVDGCLIYSSDTKLYKCSLSDGSTVASADMAGSSAFTYTAPTYGAGMIFVPLDGGKVQAFRASDLTPLWLYTDPLGGQDASPLTYGDGYLYGSFYLATGASHFVCIPVTDENPAQTNESKYASWTYSGSRAFYWAGAALAGDYVLVGSDGGTLYSFRKSSGELTDTAAVDGDIRCSIAYSGGWAYWTTKNGSLCSAALGEDGKITDLKSAVFCSGGASTSTPVVYGGNVYISGGKNGDFRLYQCSAETLQVVASTALPAASLSSWLLSKGYESGDGSLYLYGTVNSSSGPLLVAKATPGTGKLSVSTLYVPSQSGYCINSVVCDSDGTIYYKNDSGNLFAVKTKQANGCPVSFSVSPTDAVVKVSGQTAVAGNSFDLPAKTYTYTATAPGYLSGTGSFTVTQSEATAHTEKTVEISLVADPTSGGGVQPTISARLQVKVPENDTSYNCTYKASPSAYTTLVSQTVTLNSGNTVLDALDAALTTAGISYVEKSRGYIQTIGSLSEFDHGERSGWLYMVNGTVVTDNCREYSLSDGDSVMWFYSDDYTKEYGSEKWSGKATTVPETGTTLVSPEVSVSGGTARSTVSQSDLSTALTSLQKNGTGSVTIAATADASVSKTVVSVSRSGAKALADSGTGASLAVNTSNGCVLISDNALSSLATQASGSDFSLSVESVSASALKVEGEDLTNAAVVRVTLASNGSKITTFGGGTLTLTIPVADTFQEGSFYRVVSVSDNGRVEALPGKIVSVNGSRYAEVAVTHLSAFAVTTGKIASFADVPAGAWCYDAVSYVSANGLMRGTADTAFAPGTVMTRGMLVQVLYRMAGSPAVTGTSGFTDVGASRYDAAAIHWAAANGIASGYGNSRFGPEDRVSRQQMAAILYRYAAYRKFDTTGSASLDSYTDLGSVSGWAMDAMKWAAAKNILKGTSTATLTPNGGATRAQTAVMLMRFCHSVEE